MHAVIFEVEIKPGQEQAYLDRAAALREELSSLDGFISIERFSSLAQPGKLVSLSFWRDEAAIANWRRHAGHRAAQQAGRSGIFRHYRIRVAEVVRDYSDAERAQAPEAL